MWLLEFGLEGEADHERITDVPLITPPGRLIALRLMK